MRKIWIFLIAPPALVLLIAICGEVVMHLWNWLVPLLFGGRQITFWQGLGLLLLTRILFGSWGHGADHSRHRGWRDRRWERMTEEEREAFREKMRSRCGGFGPRPGETNEPA